MSTTTIALAVFLLYWAIVSVLDKRGILEKYNISTYGPVLMIRTQRGQDLLDTLAKPKGFWRLFANIGIPLMFVGMAAMLLVIILSDVALMSSFGNNAITEMPQPGKFNEPRNLLLIPGVNEFIPFTWGIIALIVTLVVHEFSHAILCRVEDIRVKSMGLLVALVPIGGFAEPDEEQLFGANKEEDEHGDIQATIDPDKVASRNQRARILAAGVMSNFVVAFVAFLLFFGPVLGAIEPLSDAMVVNVTPNSSAFDAGIRDGMVITHVDDVAVQSAHDVIMLTSMAEPNTIVKLHAAKDGDISVYEIKAGEKVKENITGVYVNGAVEDSPAEAAGFEKGMYMLKIDNTSINSDEEFIFFMDSTRANQTIHIEVLLANQTLEQDSTVVFDVKLTEYPYDNDAEKGFLGVYYGSNGVRSTPLGISVGEFPANMYLNMLKSIPSMLTGVTGWIIIFGLPIIGFAGEGFPGFSGTLAQFYQPVGWGEPLGIGLFWIANTLLWVGWLNFYVGLFNCLPAVPLDGGHVFRDYTHSFILRITGNDEKSKMISGIIAGIFSLLILASFLLMIFGPYIVYGF